MWYVLLTGLIAGGLFAGLTLWRRGLTAAYAAHLALNIVEFIAVAAAALVVRPDSPFADRSRMDVYSPVSTTWVAASDRR